MAKVKIEDIKKLRDMTGAGIGNVKEALEKSQGDFEAAINYLREKGLAKFEKRKDNIASKGFIGVYVHQNSSLVVVVQVVCETDFAAKSEDIKKFAQDIAIHIAALNTLYLQISSVPDEVIEAEKKIYENEVQGKTTEVKEKIIQGKLAKFFADNVLMEQRLFTNETKTVRDYLNELVAKLGEKIEISYFYKFSINDGIHFSHLNS